MIKIFSRYFLIGIAYSAEKICKVLNLYFTICILKDRQLLHNHYNIPLLKQSFVGIYYYFLDLIHINCVKNLSKYCRQTVTCSKQNMLGSVIHPHRPARARLSSPAREIEYYKSYLIKYSTVHF